MMVLPLLALWGGDPDLWLIGGGSVICAAYWALLGWGLWQVALALLSVLR